MVGVLILSPFVLAIAAAWLVSRYPQRAGVLAVWSGVLAIGFCSEHLSTVSRGPRRASYLSDVPLWKGTVLDERRGSRTEHHVDAGNRRSAASEPAAGSDA